MDQHHTSLQWNYASPYIAIWKIDEGDIDHYQHVNNVAYVAKTEQLAWQHTKSLGLTFADYQQHDVGIVVHRHELNYLLPCHLGDEIICATWVTHCDQKLRINRHFQFIHSVTQKTIFTGDTHFICTSLSSGKAKRLPPSFAQIYSDASIGITK